MDKHIYLTVFIACVFYLLYWIMDRKIIFSLIHFQNRMPASDSFEHDELKCPLKRTRASLLVHEFLIITDFTIGVHNSFSLSRNHLNSNFQSQNT